MITLPYILDTFVYPFLKFSLIIGAGFLLSSIAGKIITKVLAKSQLDISLVRFLARSAKIAIIIIAFVSALGALGISTTGIIAALSAVGAAIALALHGSLSNIAGGIFILMTRPFVTGNFVEINGMTGTVKDIQLIHTVILTPDNKEVIMPNGVVVNSTVVNMSNEEKRRVDLKFNIPYGNDARLAEELILKTAAKHELTLRDPAEPFVRVSAHNENSVEISARVWCLSSNYWTLYFDLLEQVRDEFKANGITAPHSQVDIHMDK